MERIIAPGVPLRLTFFVEFSESEDSPYDINQSLIASPQLHQVSL